MAKAILAGEHAVVVLVDLDIAQAIARLRRHLAEILLYARRDIGGVDLADVLAVLRLEALELVAAEVVIGARREAAAFDRDIAGDDLDPRAGDAADDVAVADVAGLAETMLIAAADLR